MRIREAFYSIGKKILGHLPFLQSTADNNRARTQLSRAADAHTPCHTVHAKTTVRVKTMDHLNLGVDRFSFFATRICHSVTNHTSFENSRF